MGSDNIFVAYLSPLLGLGAGLVLSLTGLAVGGAARYGLAPGLRRPGGWILAAAGVLLFIGLLLAWRGASREAGFLAVAVGVIAGWLPGFVAASLGAGRWWLVAMIPAGLFLQYTLGFATQSAAISPA